MARGGVQQLSTVVEAWPVKLRHTKLIHVTFVSAKNSGRMREIATAFRSVSQ